MLIRERLMLQEQQHFVGRQQELAFLLETLHDEGPLVTFVHGIGGIGKSTLLHAFSDRARRQGAWVIHLDCRVIEPSERGLFHALGAALGMTVESLPALADHLAQYGERVVLAFDTYEVFRLLDTWLRQHLIPELPDNVRVVFFGREAPVAAWATTPGWQGLVRSLRLSPLNDDDAAALLRRARVHSESIAAVNQFAKGHPLALQLAATALAERPGLHLQEIEASYVVDQLVRLYMEDVRDPLTRRALEAASVIRRATLPLLASMLPDDDPQAAYNRLWELPFVECRQDGLVIHDMVQQAISLNLRAADPARYQRYRHAAWQRLRGEIDLAGRQDSWRYLADVLYLVENPLVHNAFFPPDAHVYQVEPARPDDLDVILAMTLEQDGPNSAAITKAWWQHIPEAFIVLREQDGKVAGFYIMFNPAEVSQRLLRDDPMTWNWWQHLRADPIPRDQTAMFIRRLLICDRENLHSPVWAAAALDIKRYYLANPRLRRVYAAQCESTYHGEVTGELGFEAQPALNIQIDDRSIRSLLLDLGPKGMIGWLTRMVDARFNTPQNPNRLDVDARELVVDGQHIALSPLEFGVLHYLTLHEGKAISRMDLLAEVWGYEYDGGSNVVDSIVRALRRKLGPHASAIETVTGVGYKFRGF